jgi:DNA-directed RNA polymerase subunit RPC12/RpoP
MMCEQRVYECMRCGRKITEGEYEAYSGLCEECHEIEIDELDYEDEYGC